MSIRKSKKDHLREHAGSLTLVSAQEEVATSTPLGLEDPLMLWTGHEKETAPTDFNNFRTGEHAAPIRGAHKWTSPFNGRPELIAQLMPVLKDLLWKKAPDTVENYVKSFKSWWRLFSKVEEQAFEAGHSVKPVNTVADLFELHRELAFQSMCKHDFMAFIRVVNIKRQALKLGQLHWQAPSDKEVVRRIPEKRHTDPIRHALKHSWYDALSRWALAEKLLCQSDKEFKHEQMTAIAQEVTLEAAVQLNSKAKREEYARLRENYKRYQAAIALSDHPAPPLQTVRGDCSKGTFSNTGQRLGDMIRGFYPDAYDVKAALNHCAASTGWNKETLLDLDAVSNFIEILQARPAPLNGKPEPERYLMTGWKARSNTEVYTEGLTKSQGSAGMVIQELIRRTAPLREQLRKDLIAMEDDYTKLLQQPDVHQKTLLAKLREIKRLRLGIRSAWLYVNLRTGITWLDPVSCNLGNKKGTQFLRQFVDDLNEKRPPDDPIPYIATEQFRDIFATYIYRQNGGSILHVKQALGHKQVTSTQKYIDNNLIRADSDKNWRTFQQHFWQGASKGIVDPTLLAKLCRDGQILIEEKQRLVDYRELRRSRIGVRCKDPTNPPRYIDPEFTPNGHSKCVNHVCTLCLENAVVAPDSMPGLSMRLAELRHIKNHMSVTVFSTSMFAVELNNTEIALTLFEPNEVNEHIARWEQRIASGEHRVPELFGTQGVDK